MFYCRNPAQVKSCAVQNQETKDIPNTSRQVKTPGKMLHDGQQTPSSSQLMCAKEKQQLHAFHTNNVTKHALIAVSTNTKQP